jgi:hypothetical protein
MAFIDKDNLTIVTSRKGVLKKSTEIVATVRIYVAAGEAKPAAPLSPVLGQHQINAMDFCKRFNELSAGFEAGVPLPTIVYKRVDGTFDIHIRPPTFNLLLWLLLDEGTSKTLGCSELYDLVRQESVKLKCGTELSSKIVFAVLNSMANKVIIKV